MSPTLAGTVRWAVVPYAPAAPFRIYAGPEREPVSVPLESLVAARTKGGDPEISFLTTGKLRPVLILNDPREQIHNEITALRLLRFSKLGTDEQQQVRDQRYRRLFHLSPARVDLPEENAALVSALVRINVSAIEPVSRGALTTEEMRVLGERIIDFYGFDTRLLVERRLRELAARQRPG